MNLSRKRIKKLLINKNKNQTKKKFIKNKKKYKGKSFRNRKINLRTNTLKKRRFAKYKRQKRKSYIKGGAKKFSLYLNKYSEVLKSLNDGEDENLEKDIFYNFDFILDKDENIQKIIEQQTLIKEFEDGTKEGDKLGKIQKVTKKDISKNIFNYDLASGEYNLNFCDYEIKGDYCVYNTGLMKKFSRWWHNENYEKTFKYLDDDFTVFARYLDNLKQISLINGKLLYGKIIIDTNKFIDELVKGLYNLKETYSVNHKLKAKIESIILILLDFKNENTN